MKSLPCPKCGSKDVVDTFCASCLRELHPLIGKVKEPHITFCVLSGDVKLQNAWESIDHQFAVEKAIKKSLTPGEGVTITDITVAPIGFDFLEKPGIDRTEEIAVTITGSMKGVPPYTEEYTIPLHVKTTSSKKYSKMGTQYYEGTLQLRNEQEMHYTALKKHFSRYPDLAINKTMTRGTGHDYQITSKQRMRQIAHKLHLQFGGVFKENARLITRDNQTSKDVYRLTIFIEFPPFVKDDVLTDGKRVLQVRKFGKKITYQNILTGKKVEAAYEKDTLESVETHQARISQVRPELAILDPETYQQVLVRSREELVVDQEVTVVKHHDSWYVV